MNAEEAHGSMSEVLRNVLASHWPKILLCILLISGGTITQYFFIYTATYAINTLHYSQGWAMTANMATGITGMVFAVAGGALADKVGIRSVVLLPRLIATLLLYPVLHLVVSSGSPLVLVIAMAGLMAIHAMTSAAGIVLIPMIFPAAVRTSALSIAYALGVTIFGGTAQLVFTWIIDATGDKLSWVWYVIVMSLISFLGTLAIRVPEDLGGKSQAKQPDAMLAGASD
jgi:MFS family permease